MISPVSKPTGWPSSLSASHTSEAPAVIAANWNNMVSTSRPRRRASADNSVSNAGIDCSHGGARPVLPVTR